MGKGGDEEIAHVRSVKRIAKHLMVEINWRYFAGLPTTTKYVTGEEMEDAYWKTLIAGHDPVLGSSSDMNVVKTDYLAWSQHIKKYASLKHLPSPIFEKALTGTIALSVISKIVRYLVSLPIILPPSEFSDLKVCTGNRKLIKTGQGYIGLAGQKVKPGDWVAVCKGGKFPLVVRKEHDGVLRLISDCYVHGIMGGESFDEQKCERMWFC